MHHAVPTQTLTLGMARPTNSGLRFVQTTPHDPPTPMHPMNGLHLCARNVGREREPPSAPSHAPSPHPPVSDSARKICVPNCARIRSLGSKRRQLSNEALRSPPHMEAPPAIPMCNHPKN